MRDWGPHSEPFGTNGRQRSRHIDDAPVGLNEPAEIAATATETPSLTVRFWRVCPVVSAAVAQVAVYALVTLMPLVTLFPPYGHLSRLFSRARSKRCHKSHVGKPIDELSGTWQRPADGRTQLDDGGTDVWELIWL